MMGIFTAGFRILPDPNASSELPATALSLSFEMDLAVKDPRTVLYFFFLFFCLCATKKNLKGDLSHVLHARNFFILNDKLLGWQRLKQSGWE